MHDDTILLIAFFATALGSVWSLLVYPIILLFFSSKRRPVPMEPSGPSAITIIITAFNEEDKITQKISETLTWAKEGMDCQIIVASDGSTDRTDELVRHFTHRGVQLVRNVGPRGKEYAQQRALQHASGDVIVFTDAASSSDSDVLVQFIETFKDASIGAVSATDRLRTRSGESLYQQYEMWLRMLESRVNTTVAITGALFACRKSVCDDWDPTITSDFGTALRCIRRNLRVVSAPRIRCYYDNVSGDVKEYWRKFRTTVRGITAMWRNRDLLNPVRYGFAAFQLWNHKLLRWAMPWFLAANMLLCMRLALFSSIFCVVLLTQVTAVVLAVSAWIWPLARKIWLARLCSYIAVVNLAMAHAAIAFACGKRIVAWKPSERSCQK